MTGNGEDVGLVALLRQHYEVFAGRPPGGTMFWAESDDGGATWSRFRKSGLWGYPSDPVALMDGSILSIYGHRKDPMSIKVALSDDGRCWEEENASILYRAPNFDEDGRTAARSLDSGYRHIGYPSSAVLDDGSVLSVFHSFNEVRKQIVLLASYRIVRQ